MILKDLTVDKFHSKSYQNSNQLKKVYQQTEVFAISIADDTLIFLL